MTESDGEIQVSMGAEILFDTGESELRARATEALAQLATLIAEHSDGTLGGEG